MADLEKAIARVRTRIEKHGQSRSMNEQSTKSALIEPILRALGWDVEDVDEVVHEYRRKQQDNPVDFAMMVVRVPRLFLEAKALRRSLDDPKWIKQALGYASVAGVQWVVLSNGDEYRIYNSHAVVPIEKKLFRKFRLTEPDPEIPKILSLISKRELQEKTIDLLWNAHYIDNHVKAAVEDLFHGGGTDALIELIRGANRELSVGDVRASLQRASVTVDYPAELERLILRTVRRSRAKKARPVTAAPSVTLEDLISRGVVQLPCALSAKYKGVQLEATIEEAERVVFGGKPYSSLSAAASAARAHVLGLKAGAPGPATNGWGFWSCTVGAVTGRIGDLRNR